MTPAIRARKEPAQGRRKALHSGREFGIIFDDEMAAAIRRRAARYGISFAEQVRTYCQWGLENDSADSDD